MSVQAFLYVDQAVAALQFDLDTLGSINLDPSIPKQLAYNRLPNGKLRILIFGLNLSTFIGKFASADARINSIGNVVAADPVGIAIDASIGLLSKPEGIGIFVIK